LTEHGVIGPADLLAHCEAAAGSTQREVSLNLCVKEQLFSFDGGAIHVSAVRGSDIRLPGKALASHPNS
jgi:hypothetical protein